LKNLEVPLAILCPKNYRSTYMIDIQPSNNSIKLFEFNNSPSECVDEMIEWAEDITLKNESHYRRYPWRTSVTNKD